MRQQGGERLTHRIQLIPDGAAAARKNIDERNPFSKIFPVFSLELVLELLLYPHLYGRLLITPGHIDSQRSWRRQRFNRARRAA